MERETISESVVNALEISRYVLYQIFWQMGRGVS